MSLNQTHSNELIETYREQLFDLPFEPETTYLERVKCLLDTFRLEHDLSVRSRVYSELYRITTSMAAGKKAEDFRKRAN